MQEICTSGLKREEGRPWAFLLYSTVSVVNNEFYKEFHQGGTEGTERIP